MADNKVDKGSFDRFFQIYFAVIKKQEKIYYSRAVRLSTTRDDI